MPSTTVFTWDISTGGESHSSLGSGRSLAPIFSKYSESEALHKQTQARVRCLDLPPGGCNRATEHRRTSDSAVLIRGSTSISPSRVRLSACALSCILTCQRILNVCHVPMSEKSKLMRLTADRREGCLLIQHDPVPPAGRKGSTESSDRLSLRMTPFMDHHGAALAWVCQRGFNI